MVSKQEDTGIAPYPDPSYGAVRERVKNAAIATEGLLGAPTFRCREGQRGGFNAGAGDYVQQADT